MRTYESTKEISKTKKAWRGIEQVLHEDGMDFSLRINLGTLTSGNVHNEDEKMTVLIDRLGHSIWTTIVLFRDNENHRQMTYKSLMRCAKDEEHPYCARLCMRRQKPRAPSRLRSNKNLPPETLLFGYFGKEEAPNPPRKFPLIQMICVTANIWWFYLVPTSAGFIWDIPSKCWCQISSLMEKCFAEIRLE